MYTSVILKVLVKGHYALLLQVRRLHRVIDMDGSSIL